MSKQVFLKESELRNYIRETIKACLTEGTTSDADANNWYRIQERLGSEKMLDELYAYLNADQIRDFVMETNRNYELGLFNDEESDEDMALYESVRAIVKEAVLNENFFEAESDDKDDDGVKDSDVYMGGKDIDGKVVSKTELAYTNAAKEILRNDLIDREKLADQVPGLDNKAEGSARSYLSKVARGERPIQPKMAKAIVGAVDKIDENLEELSPKLLDRASEKAYELERYNQGNAFSDEANNRRAEEFNSDDIVKATNKTLKYNSGILRNVICSNGDYYTSSNTESFSSESGNFAGMSSLPKDLKTDSKITARKIAKWCEGYLQAEALNFNACDWHTWCKL